MRQGFILILFILPFFAFSAQETPAVEGEPEKANKGIAETSLPRSFTPSQIKRIAALKEEIERNYAHEIETLNFQGEDFLALYRPAQSSTPQGCIILLHGNNEHPNWPNVINPVRTSLTKSSWCTLSIEIPDSMTKEALSFIKNNTEGTEDESEVSDKITLPNEEKILGRIDASIAFANAQGVNNISLLGYGTGATYALKYSTTNKLESGALILISATIPNKLAYFPFVDLLKDISQPTLDYYIRPNQFNKHYADARLSLMQQRKTNIPIYTQIKVTSNSQFAIDEKQLIQRIRGFLKQNTKQREQLKQLPPFSKSLFYQSP